jgi:hypothetical protein
MKKSEFKNIIFQVKSISVFRHKYTAYGGGWGTHGIHHILQYITNSLLFTHYMGVPSTIFTNHTINSKLIVLMSHNMDERKH